MSENQTMPIMLFILGLFLIALGVGLGTVTQTVIRYRQFYGFSVPYEETIHPYEGPSAVLVIIGIVILAFAFRGVMKRKLSERTW